MEEIDTKKIKRKMEIFLMILAVAITAGVGIYAVCCYIF